MFSLPVLLVFVVLSIDGGYAGVVVMTLVSLLTLLAAVFLNRPRDPVVMDIGQEGLTVDGRRMPWHEFDRATVLDAHGGRRLHVVGEGWSWTSATLVASREYLGPLVLDWNQRADAQPQRAHPPESLKQVQGLVARRSKTTER